MSKDALLSSTTDADTTGDAPAGCIGPMIGPLNQAEQARLHQLRRAIQGSITSAFAIIGPALAEIRDRKLYRETHDTFEDFARGEFEIARARAYQYIDAAKVFENVHHGGQMEILPANERQIRPLTLVKDPDDQVRVWQRAVETAADGKVTGRHVARTVAEFLGAAAQRKAETTRGAIASSTELPDGLRQSFHEFVSIVMTARSEARHREAMRRHLQGLLNLLED